MTDPSESCPYGFKLYQHGGVRACGRQSSSVGSCVALKLLADDISYSQVCGRVVGYQYGSTDAVDSTIGLTLIMILILIMLMVLISFVGLLVNMSGH